MQEKEVRAPKREAELRALRFQVNPHFMFNSLNAIAALTSTEPEQARRMCLLLSDFLRASLRMGERTSVPLKEELDLVRGYLEVERVRFPDRLEVKENIQEDCLGIQFPPLLLQPLVENAIKHGVAGLEDGGQIKLEAGKDSDWLRVAVENPYDPEVEPQPGSGRGLAIVEDRIRAFAGKDARMVISKTESRYRVEITMNVGEGSQ
jgi:two-component system, LytTR family, sensor histidine kinase AlgZ